MDGFVPGKGEPFIECENRLIADIGNMCIDINNNICELFIDVIDFRRRDFQLFLVTPTPFDERGILTGERVVAA